MSTEAGGTDHLFLFTYANWLLITCPFRFNINYVFVYLFKAMSTKAGGTTTCFYLLMEIDCWFNVFFVWIFIITPCKRSFRKLCFYMCLSLILFTGGIPACPPDGEPPCMENGEPPPLYGEWRTPRWRTPRWRTPPVWRIPWDVEPPPVWRTPPGKTTSGRYASYWNAFLSFYWFIESDVNKSSWKRRPLFTYGNHLLIWCSFCFNIHYLFIYLLKAMSTKAAGNDDLYLLMEITCWFHVVFVLIFIIYLFIYLFKAMSTRAGWSDHLFLFTFLWMREILFVIFYARIDF